MPKKVVSMSFFTFQSICIYARTYRVGIVLEVKQITDDIEFGSSQHPDDRVAIHDCPLH